MLLTPWFGVSRPRNGQWARTLRSGRDAGSPYEIPHCGEGSQRLGCAA